MKIATEIPEAAMPIIAAKRALIDPQISEWEKGNKLAALVPIFGPIASSIYEAHQRGEDVSAALQSLMALSAAHETAPHIQSLKRIAADKVKQLARSAGPGESVARELVKKTGEENAEIGKSNKIKARENALAGKTNEEHNRAHAKKYEEDLREANKNNLKAHIENLRDTAEANQSNAAAKAVPDARAGLEKTIEEKSSQRKTAIEAAEKSAKEDLDSRYAKQRELLNKETIPAGVGANALTGENIHQRMVEAFRSFITNPEAEIPATMKKVLARTDPASLTTPPDWRELSGLRTTIGKELSTGKLSGEQFQGYMAALKVLDDGLQKIADENGVGDEVRMNREDYAHFANTFYNPIAEPNTIARKTQTYTSPEHMRVTEESSRREALNKYDKNIGTMGSEIDSLTHRLSALPSESTRPTANAPKEVKEITVEPPKHEKLPPEKPIEPNKTIGTEELRSANADKLKRDVESIKNSKSPFINAIAALDVIRSGIQGNWSRVGIDVASRAIYELGKQGYARLLEQPSVMKFLIEPTAKQLSTIPPGMRGVIRPIIKAAQSKGIAVNPKLLRAAGVTVAAANASDAWSGPQQ
jgi:hypothetical protein